MRTYRQSSFKNQLANILQLINSLNEIIYDQWKQCGKTVMGTPPDLKGKHPLTPYSGFTPGTPVFTHYTSA